MKKMLLLLFLTQIGMAQNTDVNKLLVEGEKAFLSNDFNLAKEIYTNVTSLDSLNKRAWYNRAACELSLGEKDDACEHFYKVYLLNDGAVLKDIKENCPNFRNGTIMWLDEVDEEPKFIYEKKEFPLLVDKSFNPFYLKILINKINESDLLRKKSKGRVFIRFNINKLGVFDGKIMGGKFNEEDAEIIKKEILRIFSSMVSYIPAKHNETSVDFWDQWTLPINFGF
jgi:hypothetical protein